jgi:hypothetical protein
MIDLDPKSEANIPSYYQLDDSILKEFTSSGVTKICGPQR